MNDYLLSAISGMILPIPISALKALLTNDKTPLWVVYLLSLVISIAVGSLCAYLTTGDILENIAIVVAVTQTSYNTIVKSVGLDDTIVKWTRAEK